jgi:hypothetical protein
VTDPDVDRRSVDAPLIVDEVALSVGNDVEDAAYFSLQVLDLIATALRSMTCTGSWGSAGTTSAFMLHDAS